MLYMAAQTFESVKEFVRCVHSGENYRGLLCFGALYFKIWQQGI